MESVQEMKNDSEKISTWKIELLGPYVVNNIYCGAMQITVTSIHKLIVSLAVLVHIVHRYRGRSLVSENYPKKCQVIFPTLSD